MGAFSCLDESAPSAAPPPGVFAGGALQIATRSGGTAHRRRRVGHCGAGAVLGFGFTVAGTALPFEIGLFGWVALMAFVFYPAPHTACTGHARLLVLMQIGMITGFATAWPANVWLIRRGTKEAM